MRVLLVWVFAVLLLPVWLPMLMVRIANDYAAGFFELIKVFATKD